MWPSSGGVPGPYPMQEWSLNPSAYKNVPYDQVDWATLAQQWIKMKERTPYNIPIEAPMPPPSVPTMIQAPPAPRISSSSLNHQQFNESSTRRDKSNEQHSKDIVEGGEAPMDMDTKDDETPAQTSVPGGDTWKQWNNWQSSQPHWGWGWPGNSGTVPMAPSDMQSGPTAVECKVKTQNTDSSFPVYNSYVAGGVPNFPIIGNIAGTTNVPTPPAGSVDLTSNGGNSNNFSPSRIDQRLNVLPPCIPNVTTNNFWNKPDPKSSRRNTTPVHTNEVPMLDAMKRKQLPAWIREGLNKMEKEKQRKLEKERTTVENKQLTVIEDDVDTVKSHRSGHDSSLLSTNITSNYNRQKSDENINDFSTNIGEASLMVNRRKSRFDDPRSGDRESAFDTGESPKEVNKPKFESSLSSSRIRKTKDQLLTETMLKVRRILTEILLETTTQQVHAIVKEEYSKAHSTGVIVQPKRCQSLKMLGNNLGLMQYGSDSDKSDSDSENDSDEELKAAIERKKVEFRKTEEEIEKEIEDQEEKERRMIENENKASREIIGSESDNESNSEGNREEPVTADVNKISADAIHPMSEAVTETSNRLSDSKSSYKVKSGDGSRKSSSAFKVRLDDSNDDNKRDNKKVTVTMADNTDRRDSTPPAPPAPSADNVRKKDFMPSAPPAPVISNITGNFGHEGKKSSDERSAKKRYSDVDKLHKSVSSSKPKVTSSVSTRTSKKAEKGASDSKNRKKSPAIPSDTSSPNETESSTTTGSSSSSSSEGASSSSSTDSSSASSSEFWLSASSDDSDSDSSSSSRKPKRKSRGKSKEKKKRKKKDKSGSKSYSANKYRSSSSDNKESRKKKIRKRSERSVDDDSKRHEQRRESVRRLSPSGGKSKIRIRRSSEHRNSSRERRPRRPSTEPHHHNGRRNKSSSSRRREPSKRQRSRSRSYSSSRLEHRKRYHQRSSRSRSRGKSRKSLRDKH